MSIFDTLSLIGGLALFLFGMNIMGDALEKRAGGTLQSVLSKITSSKWKGLLLGMVITAVIQSSSATTVMVVGFVNSGIMALRQAINVIMGANIGTTVTSWLLSLTGIEGDNIFVQLLKPSSFTPILALIGIVCYMFLKSSTSKDIGQILMGFAVLMFGMETMSDAVAPLKNVPEFQNILLTFTNPILGVIAGAVLTAVIQSSSASVGILQALCATGKITFSSAIPIIMGQNIGTCVTALISSVGANKGAKRAAVVHLVFNIGGTIIWLSAFEIVSLFVDFSFFDSAIGAMGIAVIHSIFNILCTITFFPFTKQLEKIACLIIADDKKEQKYEILDTRLYSTPAVALENVNRVVNEMTSDVEKSLKLAFGSITDYNPKAHKQITEYEKKGDKYEDEIGNYLIGLSSLSITDKDSLAISKYLHFIGELEKLSDHALSLSKSAEEIHKKELTFSDTAKAEIENMINAVEEILNLTVKTVINNDLVSASYVSPLEDVIDDLKKQLHKNHIKRLQNNGCSIEMGFILSDITTSLERISDHCNNLAIYVIDNQRESLGLHQKSKYLKKTNSLYQKKYENYCLKYMA
ncbi:MAG: Na/Pi cotransporter family protein [Oscillospiraceae bacterium]|nr:Na/Pi cotransporter family protein [Oscillospiraceae bacterium]